MPLGGGVGWDCKAPVVCGQLLLHLQLGKGGHFVIVAYGLFLRKDLAM